MPRRSCGRGRLIVLGVGKKTAHEWCRGRSGAAGTNAHVGSALARLWPQARLSGTTNERARLPTTIGPSLHSREISKSSRSKEGRPSLKNENKRGQRDAHTCTSHGRPNTPRARHHSLGHAPRTEKTCHRAHQETNPTDAHPREHTHTRHDTSGTCTRAPSNTCAFP